MPKEDFDALRAEYAAMSRGDWDAALRGAHPDFELKTPVESLDIGEIRGVERARRVFQDFFAPYQEVKIEPEAFFEGKGQIVVFFLQRARPLDSAAVVETRAAHVWTMRHGRAAKLEIFPKRAKALEAAGLTEQDRAEP
jgi:ketosteroid isomerase-like protein